MELTRHLKTECELLPIQCEETVEFLQLMCGHLNLTLLLIDTDAGKVFIVLLSSLLFLSSPSPVKAIQASHCLVKCH